MSISGRRNSAFRVFGKGRPKLVSKIRRTKQQAYGSSWDALSAEVIRRAGGICQQCFKGNRRLEAHHIIPVSKGGVTAFFNLKALCEDCHSKQPGHKHLKHHR